ncbi:LysR substrate-binding domain-containing protein [Poseidonocella sp. HB161398]|uniref:LysR substrate-binding domain-containing protein n=1 Tax=Poseidonocella sp. HB161398 TaxID=2320855 RepID=UPI001107D393|nr:LysR substrate-binding domain-containing protein [Poseidonocella sp. HB161398]
MEIAALEIFRAVAREEGITRAAGQLGRAPSNVTTRIQQLEAEIGTALFQRDRKRMVLTPEGRTFLGYAERILSLAEEARQQVNPARPAGKLRIGAMDSTAAARLPQPLAAFALAWPEVEIALSTGPTRRLVDAVLEHRLDCALIALPPGETAEGLELVPVFREELLLLLPPGHPPVAGPADLQKRVLAAFAPGCSYRQIALDWLAGGGAGPVAVQEVGSCHAMYACTAAGACISVMPRSTAERMDPGAAVGMQPIAVSETLLACRPGFATAAFAEFREALAGGEPRPGPSPASKSHIQI